MNKKIGLEPLGEPRIACISKNENNSINLSSQCNYRLKILSILWGKKPPGSYLKPLAAVQVFFDCDGTKKK